MIEGNQGVLFEANCETDFVSKNPDFIDFTKSVAQMIVKESPADVAALSAMPMGGQHSFSSEYLSESSSLSRRMFFSLIVNMRRVILCEMGILLRCCYCCLLLVS
jgi:translation elongation factor EF-Ts